jgi:hypothetical protein
MGVVRVSVAAVAGCLRSARWSVPSELPELSVPRGGVPVGSGDDEVVDDDRGDGGLLEDRPRALVGVVGVHGDIGGAREQDAHDRDVEVDRARPDADPDLVANAHAGVVQGLGDRRRGLVELGIRQARGPVVDRRDVGALGDSLAEDVDEGAWPGRKATTQVCGVQRLRSGRATCRHRDT